MKAYKLFASLCIGAAILSSCKKEDPIIPNQEELITTLTYTLISQDLAADTVIFSFVDLDGPGGNPPSIVGGTLNSTTAYKGTLQLLNEQDSPAEDITLEVIAEAEDHQFFFQNTLMFDFNIFYEDADINGNPLGVETKLLTGNASSGQLTITLRHEPDKFAQGVNLGDISNAGGETDIEVTFDVDVQ